MNNAASSNHQTPSIGSSSRHPSPQGPVPAPCPPKGHSPARPSTSAVSQELRQLLGAALDAGYSPGDLEAVIRSVSPQGAGSSCPECGANMSSFRDGFRCGECGVTCGRNG
jgi:hypothetical protein